MELKEKIANYEKMHRLNMIRYFLNETKSYVNDVVGAVEDDFDYEEKFNEEESSTIIARVKSDLETLIKEYM